MNKAISKIQNKLLNVIKVFLLSLMLVNLIKCSELSEIDAGDSGFSLSIRNFTESEYIGCKFYMGAYDLNNNFIAVDSLVYPNLKIFKKNEGSNINVEDGYSTTYPFRESTKGLNEYGYWSPKYPQIENVSGNRDIVFKFQLDNGAYKITAPINFSNGSLSPTIRESGISW